MAQSLYFTSYIRQVIMFTILRGKSLVTYTKLKLCCQYQCSNYAKYHIYKYNCFYKM